MCRIFDEETAGDGGVCVEAYFELVEEGKEVFFDVSGHGVVVSLENGGKKGTQQRTGYRRSFGRQEL